MEDKRSNNGGTVDVEFTLSKSGKVVVVHDIDITVWDALRKSETEEYSDKYKDNSTPFTKQFIWGSNSGIKVREIAAYKVLKRN